MPDAETTTADPFELATAAAIADLQAALRATADAEAAAGGAIGHGTIRLRDRPAPEPAPEPTLEQEPAPEPAPQPEPAEPRGVPARDELPEQPAAAVSGTAVGHGTIRLRGQSPRSTTPAAATTPEPGAAAGTAPVATPEPDAAAGTGAAGPTTGPVGHGEIRLHAQMESGFPESVTAAARDDVLAALAATT